MTSLLIGITVLMIAAYCVTLALRRNSAAVRHVVWTCAIVATLLFAPLRWIAPQRMVNGTLPSIFTPTLDVHGTTNGGVRDFVPMAIALWITGGAVVALRLVVSSVRLRRIIVNANAEGSAGPIPIACSPLVPGPLVTGILRPVILLPIDASTWTPSRRRAVLAHELAHVRRRDPLVLLAAHFATILYWFHPLCWLAAARLRAESERASDDAALRIGLLPSGYAGHLLDLARTFNPQPAIPMATTSHLESRVKSILDPFINRSNVGRRTWLGALVITAAVVAPLTVFSLRAQEAPKLIRIGGNMQATKLIYKVMPVYPENLKAQGIEGTVLLNVVVSKEGVISGMNVESATGGSEFVPASVDAVRQWRYEPTLLDGEPVEVATTVTINFTLQK